MQHEYNYYYAADLCSMKILLLCSGFMQHENTIIMQQIITEVLY